MWTFMLGIGSAAYRLNYGVIFETPIDAERTGVSIRLESLGIEGAYGVVGKPMEDRYVIPSRTLVSSIHPRQPGRVA